MRRFSLLLAALLVLPPAQGRAFSNPEPSSTLSPASDQLLARGGRGGGGGGGGRSMGGSGGGGRAPRGNTGLDRTPRSFDRGNRTPSGGWSRDVVNRPDKARPSLDRTSFDNNRLGNRGGAAINRGDRMAPANRGDRMANVNRADRMAPVNRDAVRDRAANLDRQGVQDRMANVNSGDRFANVNRDAVRDRANAINQDDWNRAGDRIQNGWNQRRDNLNTARDSWAHNRNELANRVDRASDRYNNYWPGWVRPGWALARPWNWGWYGGWSNPPWGWWGVRSVAWGLTSLATAAAINNAVNDAIAASQTTIVVPDTTYQLYYNSIEPSGDQGVNFVVSDGTTSWQWSADCRSGTLNGNEPASSGEAQVLNAACQVAFGS